MLIPVHSSLAPEETASSSRDRALAFKTARASDPWDGRISREAAFEQNLQSKA